MFDVLEHIKEDQSVVRQIFHLVKPGGLFMVTVPATPFMELF
jgi:2-polyprenyl-3-methyl-5-hydroxy-6-metoxy-1,4-benzoquinol methylase